MAKQPQRLPSLPRHGGRSCFQADLTQALGSVLTGSLGKVLVLYLLIPTVDTFPPWSRLIQETGQRLSTGALTQHESDMSWGLVQVPETKPRGEEADASGPAGGQLKGHLGQ